MKELDIIEANNALRTVREFILGTYTTDTPMKDLLTQEAYWKNKIKALEAH